MRGHAKAPPAGTIQRQATGLGRLFGGALATRASSLDTDGSGAPSRRHVGAIVALTATALAALFLAAPAFASKEVFNYIGPLQSFQDFGSGIFAGEFSAPRDSAVNTTGTGAPAGTVYVVDDNNHRIQRFDSNGKFESAWGKDVIAPSVDERQFVIVNGTAGIYTLTFNGSTTQPIDFDDGSFAVDNALDVLPSIDGNANVRVDPFGAGTPPRYYVTFQGKLAGADQPQLTADTSELSGTVEIKTIADGTSTTSDTGGDYEVCTVAAECKPSVAGGGKGTFNNPQSVTVDGDTGNVYVSDRDNRRINAYDGGGNFLFSVGRDVKEPDGGTEVEICEAADTCRQGDGGSGPGEIGATSTASTLGIDVSPPDENAATGTVFLADSQNRRVNTYELDGTSPASFGSSAEFGTTTPRKIAVDSRGIVYASDSNDGGRIQRYDTLDANGGGVGFLPPIIAELNERQTITFTGFSGGNKFTLTCPNGETTDPMSYSSSFFSAETYNNFLSQKCGAGNFLTSGSGTNFTVEFMGAFGNANQPTMLCTTVTGTGSCAISLEIDGHAGALVNSHTPNGMTVNSTQGLAVDPDTDGGGADEDTLYVLRNPTGNIDTPIIQQFGLVNDPGLAPAPTANDDVHAEAAGFQAVHGVDVDSRNGRLFVPTTSLVNFAEGQDRVYILDEPSSIPTPTLTLLPITEKTDTTANFKATINPLGGLVSCKFEYSTDQISWTDVPAPGCTTFDVGGGTQALSQTRTGLVPNTHYFVRLAVSRPFIPKSTVTSPVRTFDTDSVPPVVTDLGANSVFDTSARMIGTIDPRNSDTGYVFEYGLTPALGKSTAPLNIGGGIIPITVFQVVDGLTPDTTYYYRLVATNAFGATTSSQKTFHTRTDPPPPGGDTGNCPNQAIRMEQSSTFLPECRAYEMVTPTDKNQGGVSGRGGFGGEELLANISLDGQRVAFCTGALFGEPSSQLAFSCAPYVSNRGPDGWTTVNPMPPFCLYDAASGTAARRTGFISPDFKHSGVVMNEYLNCAASPLTPAGEPPAYNAYRTNIASDPFTYNLLTTVNPPQSFSGYLFVTGGSTDFSHVILSSKYNLTPTPDSPPQGSFYKLYDWEEEGHGDCVEPGGCISLLSVKPNGEPFDASEGFYKIPGYQVDGGSSPIYSAISEDGERIYFHANANQEDFSARACESGPDCSVYMREEGETTFDVDASECAEACGSTEFLSNFLWATPTGDKAVFESCAKLTDESAPAGTCSGFPFPSSMKLYRWDRNGLPGNRLVDITIDNEAGDGVLPQGADVLGGSTEDLPSGNAAAGNTIYFVAGGQLVSGELAPTFEGANPAGGLKLYRWQWNDGDPGIAYLGRYQEQYYDGGTIGNQITEGPNFDRYHTRVTADGRYIAIQTTLKLDPASDRDSDSDVYRWGEAEGWECVSCQAPGVPSAGHVTSSLARLAYNAEFAELGGHVPEQTISDDGQHIFFSTPDALVPEDVNGEAGCPGAPPSVAAFEAILYTCTDVYEWHDGTVSLLTSGTGSRPAQYVGASADGKDVYVATGQRLVGWDVDNGVDIYDIRVNGGFKEPVADPPTCEGEACRGQGTSSSNVPGAGTAVFEGPGNTPKSVNRPKRCKRGFVKRRGRCVSRKKLRVRKRAARKRAARKRAARKHAGRAASQSRGVNR